METTSLRNGMRWLLILGAEVSQRNIKGHFECFVSSIALSFFF